MVTHKLAQRVTVDFQTTIFINQTLAGQIAQNALLDHLFSIIGGWFRRANTGACNDRFPLCERLVRLPGGLSDRQQLRV